MSSQAQPLPDQLSPIAQQQTLYYLVGVIALISFLALVYFIKTKNTNKKSHFKVKLLQKNYITHDTAIFTFLLPPNRKTLGLKVGEHLEIQVISQEGKSIARKYTPISPIDRQSTFQLLIKIYRKSTQFPEGGAMSQFLDALQVNQSIDISLPYGRFNYQQQGQVKITTLDKTIIKKTYKNFFMVAGGTGITPIYQIIQYITENELESSPNLTLLFANRSEDDILLLNELKDYASKNKKFNLLFSVDKSVKQGWTGMKGFIDEEKISQSLGNFTDDIENTIFLSCGPPILSNIVQKIWRSKYNVKTENMFRF